MISKYDLPAGVEFCDHDTGIDWVRCLSDSSGLEGFKDCPKCDGTGRNQNDWMPLIPVDDPGDDENDCMKCNGQGYATVYGSQLRLTAEEEQRIYQGLMELGEEMRQLNCLEKRYGKDAIKGYTHYPYRIKDLSIRDYWLKERA